MRVGISGKEKYLEKEHAGCPHGWRPAEPRQNIFSENELSPKKQESAEKNCEREADFVGRLLASH
jgi:hypothetical protein